MKSLVARQKACLLAALASLNNNHSSNLHAYYTSMKSSSRPNLVPTRPLRTCSMAWWSSHITNLSSIVTKHMPTTEVEARAVTGRYHVVTMTLAHNFIWPCNNFMLSHYNSSFLVSPSLASKPVKRRLNLCSSCLGVLTRVSIARLTT